jgi:hypothetical protein
MFVMAASGPLTDPKPAKRGAVTFVRNNQVHSKTLCDPQEFAETWHSKMPSTDRMNRYRGAFVFDDEVLVGLWGTIDVVVTDSAGHCSVLDFAFPQSDLLWDNGCIVVRKDAAGDVMVKYRYAPLRATWIAACVV